MTTTLGDLSVTISDLDGAIKARTFEIILSRMETQRLEDQQTADKKLKAKLERKLNDAMVSKAREGDQ